MPASRLYMGVDVLQDGPGAGRRRFYAIVIDESLKIVDKRQDASLATIIRLAWELRPQAIAADNVLELSPSGTVEGLARLLSLLPPETKLIQATVTEEGFVDIREAARALGLDVSYSKPSPGRTAYLAAAIAARGGGLEVGFSREKTYVIVSRSRSSKAGGWSQQRYQRRIRASVRAAAEKVREALDSAGLDYDVFYRKSEGGYDSAVFIVYAPREKLFGLVRPHRGVDYWVRIESRYEGELVFGQKGSQTNRPIIVGVDAGMTSGLAVIDLNGKILHLGSYREADRGDLLGIVTKLGKPIVIATDVVEPPDLIRKLAAQTGARLYVPDHDLSVQEKEELASRAAEASGVRPETPHERDSLAAAYRALMDLMAKLQQVDSYVSKVDLELDVDKLKADVLSGATLAEAVERQISELLGEGQEKRQTEPQRVQERRPAGCEPPKDVELLEAQRSALEKQVEELREKLEWAERQAERIRKELKAEVLKDEEVRKLRNEVAKLSEELERTKHREEELLDDLNRLASVAVGVARGDYVLVREVDELKMSDLKRAEERLGPLSSNELVYVKRPLTFEAEAVRYLAKAKVRGIALDDPDAPLANSLRGAGLAIVRLDVSKLVRVGGIVAVPAEAVEYVAGRAPDDTRYNDVLERLVEEYREARAGSKRALSRPTRSSPSAS